MEADNVDPIQRSALIDLVGAVNGPSGFEPARGSVAVFIGSSL